MLNGKAEWNELSHRILGCCLSVHRELGPGLLESVYDDSLAAELTAQGISFTRQSLVPVKYRGQIVGESLRLDFLIESTVVLEVKAIEKIHAVHIAQVLTYLKLTSTPIGLLVNFNTSLLVEGVKRLMWTPDDRRKRKDNQGVSEEY